MSNVLACYQLLELNVISAQDLAPVGRSMRTYAIAWIDPDRKLSTRVDSQGGTNPTWNDKFVFRVDEDFLYDEESVITIDIYALHWFRDIHVGSAQVLSGDLFPPPTQPQKNTYKSTGMQFMGLQVQRPSGRPKGILNIGAAIIDSSMRSMPLYTQNSPAVGYSHDDLNKPSHQAKSELRRTKSDSSSMLGSEAIAPEHQAKARKGKASSQITPSEVSTKSKNKTSSTLSDSNVKATPKRGKLGRKKTKITSHDSQNNLNARLYVDYQVKSTPKREFQNTPSRTYNNNNNNYKGNLRATPLHAFAVTNAALEYGTPYRSNLGRRPFMTDSELGPSASEVAAVVARLPIEEGENSTVGGWSLDDSVEGLQPKVERWQTELPPVYDGSERSNMTTSSKKGKHSRRQTDGGNGLFSCFSVICGVECSIVCGGGDNNKKNRRRRVQSVDNESFL
ncbi:hypothetical protein AAZX31_20G073300 [Glycine max]|uniref:C2 domain-containing protein n=1 Tax=Glycine max TaxID=3847 RepID=I1NEL6_SOYBN|nr:uncharacterized protein LOC100779058 [Glycine max]KAG4918350.1 hypothetical protein JHK85_056631 [Glycine max]KAG5074437.1 hypothetical protein JHK84_055668 [Glycine max]KAG5077107.1 hypothetical protein JHK82_055802 [Glycine max]KAH1035124.1 hypothetical protein GYH30_055204 [Glycine max]KAH1190115.1 hypothetical protein GmHk_20G057751 [Glycine max]|eukprot:XP_003556915.1 uncharacterized protein LOC100779058 [Glycine max]